MTTDSENSMSDIVASDELVASRNVRTGYLSGPGFVDAPVRYSVVNGLAIFNGCIEMGRVEEVEEVEAVCHGRPGQAGSGGNQPDRCGRGAD